MKKYYLSGFLAFILVSLCFGQMEKADLIIYHAKIYTVDKEFTIREAMAVGNGKILETGTSKEILGKYTSAESIDAEGKPVVPGFIDAHCHFYGYALGLQQVDLGGTTSFEEILKRIEKASGDFPGEWIVGKGWDQNLWKEKKFPENTALDRLFPDRPVILTRVDGHALLANTEAIRRSEILSQEHFTAGEIEKKEGRLTGIFYETAADFMRNSVPPPSVKSQIALIDEAQHNCFAAGLTSVSDAGLEYSTVRFLDSIQKGGIMRLRINVMLNPTGENIRSFIMKGPYRTDFMNIRSIKVYADGSLGSRTALLKKAYSDSPERLGILVTPVASMRETCELALMHGYQVNTHAIGDSAVKIVLTTYAEFLKGRNDKRWRIEHAQVVDPVDLPLFGQYSIIPSVQATHATSDMYWAEERLGKTRIRWAYAYRDLLKQNGWIANGTDFPIEHIDPLLTFYAAVVRKDVKGFPQTGFQSGNALSREEALRSITVWAAGASFEEDAKGSLEPGKFADFVILDQDIMTISETGILKTRIVKTFSSGREVFPKK
jgi:predicted amidohydrolase YtcJ